MTTELEETSTFSDPSCNEQESLLPVFDNSNASNDIADGLIAEMSRMDKDDLDSLLFGSTMDTSVAHPSLDESMNAESELVSALSVLLPPTGLGGYDQTMSPANSELGASLPTSPALSPSPMFSSSPSSESGIEDDYEVEDPANFISLEPWWGASQICPPVNVQANQNSTQTVWSQLLKNNDIANLLQSEEKQQSATTVSSAYEELKKLISSVVSSTPTSVQLVDVKPVLQMSTGTPSSLSAVPGTMSISVPVSTQSIRPVAVPDSLVAADTPTGLLPSIATPVAGTNGLISIEDSTPEDSRMHSHAVCAKVVKRERVKPKLVILEEPEENYRARYESEGCRGPIHGSSDNTFPTIKVSDYSGSLWITVHLTTSSGQPHYHSIHGPGSTKVPCKEITLPAGIPAVQVLVEPDCEMTAILDSLSIRRLRNWEGDKELRKRGIDPRTWKKERKEARLLFQADIPGGDGCPEMKLSCKSRIFQCSTSGPTGNPEIWWASRTEGSVEGGDELGLIGKKFPSCLKVRFSADLPSGKVWERIVDGDKSKSHQGAGVVQTPPYIDLHIISPVTVNVEVFNGSSKGGKCSEPIEFTYRPQVNVNPIQNVTTCMSTVGQDVLKQGGIVMGLQGGTTTTTLPSCSSFVNVTVPVCETITVPASTRQHDETDWQTLVVQLKDLHQRGELSSKHIKDLCVFIQRKDMLLLQAYRSARNAGTQEECKLKFKQYLSTLVGSV